MKKTVYKLNGVDCANCGVKIEDKLSKLNGVYLSEYTYMTERLIILYDETILSDEEVENIIINTISGVRIISKKNLNVEEDDLKLTKKKNDKVKMILFRKRR